MSEKAQQERVILEQRQELSERDATIRSLESINLQYKNEVMRLTQELQIRIDIEI